MDRKKAIIISLAISFLVVTTLFCYFYFQNISKNSSSLNTPDENKSSLTKKVTLPVSDDANASVKKYYEVKDLKNESEIKKSFDEYIKSEGSSDQKGETYWSRITDDKKNEVSIDDFSSTVDIKVDEKINNLLKKDDYDLVTCYSDNKNKNYGMVLKVKLLGDYPDLYLDEVSFAKKWEETIFSDLHNVLFPEINFNQNDLGKKLEFKEDIFRYAEVKNGLFMYYLIVDDYIIVATNKSCADKMLTGIMGE